MAEWWLDSTTAANCPGNYTYTLEVSYNGQTTTKSVGFSVSGGGSVTVSSVRTADGSGNSKSSFGAGEKIRYYGYVANSTGATRTAAFAWKLSGPCGSSTLWSGNLNTPAGMAEWWLDSTTAANCPGNYTYTLEVNYNGQTTSKSVGFSVSGGGSGSGIDYHTRSEVHVFKIDMQNSKLSFEMVMASDSTNVNQNPSPRETVASMVGRTPYASRNPVLAFNADYSAQNGAWGPQGLTVKNGQRFDGRWADPDDKDGNEWKWSSLSISRSRSVRIGKQTDCKGPPNEACIDWQPPADAYYNTAGGGPLFVERGQRVGSESGANSVKPCQNEEFPPRYCDGNATDGRFKWTAVGVTENGRYLIVAVSGENKSMDEIAAVLIAEGAWRALKMDSGSSTQVWYKAAGGTLVSGAAVANAMVVFSQ
jgi:hypothetical protein